MILISDERAILIVRTIILAFIIKDFLKDHQSLLLANGAPVPSNDDGL
jgi:hypothetical protein